MEKENIKVIVFAFGVLATTKEGLREFGGILAAMGVVPTVSYTASGDLPMKCLEVVWGEIQTKTDLPYTYTDPGLDKRIASFDEMTELFKNLRHYHPGQTIIVCADPHLLRDFLSQIAYGTLRPNPFQFENGQWAELDVGEDGITAVRYHGKEVWTCLICEKNRLAPNGIREYKAPPARKKDVQTEGSSSASSSSHPPPHVTNNS